MTRNRQLDHDARVRRPAGVPASAGIVGSALLMLLASGGLAFALLYSTLHAPTPPAMGVTDMQPTDSATVPASLDVPPPPPTAVPLVSADPPAEPRTAPRPAPRASPRSTAPAHPTEAKSTAIAEPAVTDNPYDDTTKYKPHP